MEYLLTVLSLLMLVLPVLFSRPPKGRNYDG